MPVWPAAWFVLFATALMARAAPEVVFDGNTLFRDTQLMRALARYDVRIENDVTTADDGAFFLREFYFQEGFPDAEVTYEFSPERVVFRINEGERLWIGRVDYEGGAAIDRDRVRAIFESSVRQATLSPFGRLRFVQSAVEDAVAAIRLAYVADGFLDAIVDFEAVPGPARGTMDVRIRIEEGIRYTVRAVRIDGPSTPEEAALERTLQTFVNRPYRPGDEVLARTRAVDFLRSTGYYFAAARAEPEILGEGAVDLVVTIEPGQKMIFGNITANGVQRARRSAIIRRFGVKSGGPFNAAAALDGERRLWFSGAFSSVQVSTTPREDGTVDVGLSVEEGKARHLTGTVGYSEWDRAFATATFVDRNFLGSLQRFSADAYVSQRSYGGSLSLEDPWLFGQDIRGRVTAFGARRELPAYRAVSFGSVVGLSVRDNDRTLTGWGIDYEWRLVTDVDDFSDQDESELENYRLGILSFRQQVDTRNDLLAPKSGYNLRYDLGVATTALLSELSYFRATAQATWYVPLLKIEPERPFVPFLIFNHRAGLIVPYGSTDSIPVPERFFLGGPDSVRSFQFDGMAPRNSEGVPLGGLAYLQANLELQWPLWRGIFVAAFTDFGNLAPEVQQMAWDETRVAPGAGVRFYTPLGAIRLDYGLNLIRKDGDPLGNWQFGLGFTF